MLEHKLPLADSWNNNSRPALAKDDKQDKNEKKDKDDRKDDKKDKEKDDKKDEKKDKDDKKDKDKDDKKDKDKDDKKDKDKKVTPRSADHVTAKQGFLIITFRLYILKPNQIFKTLHPWTQSNFCGFSL